MPWGRLDDSLYDHPKLDDLPEDERLAAVGLWAVSISWCNRFLTDGHVPRGRIAKLGGSIDLAELLVGAELFEHNGAGYLIHDFLDFNDSRADVEDRRKKEADRKAAWRAKKGPDVGPDGTASVNGPDVPPGVPPSVPAGVPVGQDRPSRRLSRDSTRARDVARIPARPDPAHVDTTPPTPSPARGRRNARKPVTTKYDHLIQRDDDEPDAGPIWRQPEAEA